MNNLWLMLEWGGGISSLLGTFLASKNNSLRSFWLFWIISSISLGLIYLLKTQQNALFILCMISLVVQITGFLNSYEKNKKKTNNYIGVINEFLSKFFVICGCFIFIYLIYHNQSFNAISIYQADKIFMQWAIVCFNLAGLTAAASKHNYAKYCWFWWLISNTLFALFTFNSEQWGIFSQQITYVGLGLYAINNNFIKKLK